MSEEIFGPVLMVSSWTDEQEVLETANALPYGLTASIWTRDLRRALTAARAIEAGYVWINDVETRYPGVPFGGWNDSGLGLENGIYEIDSLTRTKSINIGL
jgi:betaine-aldehyde dehydrogenase